MKRLVKSAKRTRSKAKKKSEAKTNRLKRVRGSLKGTRAMKVFVSERKRQRRLTRSTAKRRAACSADGRVMTLVRNRAAASATRRKIRDSERDEVLERFERGQSVADFIDFSAGKFVKIS
jgi:hypothetical protein